MYINKNELIRRLIALTGKDRAEYSAKTIDELSSLYESLLLVAERTYIEVPYKDKNVVKLMGARYDGEKRKWYIPQGVDKKLFSKWIKD